MELNTAVERAGSESIQEGILKEFLQKNRSEVVAMSIFEYNEEEEKRKISNSRFKEGDSIEKVARILCESEETIRGWVNEKMDIKVE